MRTAASFEVVVSVAPMARRQADLEALGDQTDSVGADEGSAESFYLSGWQT